MHDLTPNGSSDFADDNTLKTDGVNAVSSVQVIVSPAGAYRTWTGRTANMLKCKILAVDFATGQRLATDNIKLNGTASSAHRHKALKQLGVSLAMTNYFSEEKDS